MHTVRGAASTPTPIRVTTFLGENSRALAAACIASWFQHIPIDELVVLDDGSLSPESVDRFKGMDPRVRVISTEEAADVVSSRLQWKRYAGLIRFARHCPLSRKLIDVPVLSTAWLNYIDSDVFFYRPVDTLWTQQVDHDDVWMMKDFQNAYALKRWQYLPNLGPHVPRNANTGLISCHASAFDPEYLDFAIRRFFDDAALSNWLTEQTLWAAMAFRRGLWFYDPQLFTFVNTLTGAERTEIVALHWATPVRHLFPTFPAVCTPQVTNGRLRELRLESANRLTAGDVYGSLIRFIVRHRTNEIRRLFGSGQTCH